VRPAAGAGVVVGLQRSVRRQRGRRRDARAQQRPQRAGAARAAAVTARRRGRRGAHGLSVAPQVVRLGLKRFLPPAGE